MSVGLIRPVRYLLGFHPVLTLSTVALAGTAWLAWPTAPSLPATIGVDDHFEGKVVLIPSDEPGSNMRLGEDFAYVDPTGKRWPAPAGLETDGASIPAVLYPIVGHPFDGSYLKAAVIHDAACPHDYESWRESHRMFYHALIRCGVGETKAKVMYAAVYHFGPRWNDPVPSKPVVNQPVTKPSEDSPYEDNAVVQQLVLAGSPAAEGLVKSGKLDAATVPAALIDAGVLDVRYDEAKRAITLGLSDESTEALILQQLFDSCRTWIVRTNPTLPEIETWTAAMSESLP